MIKLNKIHTELVTSEISIFGFASGGESETGCEMG